MSPEDRTYTGLSTRAVHGGEERFKYAKSVTQAIVPTSTYVFEDLDEFHAYKAGRSQHYEYGRYGNPTVGAAERKLAALEQAEGALLFPSGMSAVTTVLLAMLTSGQHLVLAGDCYRKTAQFAGVIERFGIQSTLVPTGDVAGLLRAVRSNTRLIFVESPTNPHLRIVDLARLVTLARERQLKVVVDSTFGTPINQRPLDVGVDLVVHSATKYLGGHNDLVAGSVCGSNSLLQALRDFRGLIGAMPDPHSAYLLIRGMKTLAVRVAWQNQSGLRLAQYLERHAKVKRVYYPGLPSHPQHDLARQQMRGFGGVVSFDIDGDLERTRAFIHALELPYLAPSLGGTESLVSHPATLSYHDLSREERLAIGIKDELVRYAVGLEDPDELIADLEQALARI